LIEEDKHLNEEEKSLLKSVSFGRLMIPVVLGLGVVFFLISRQLDLTELQRVRWDLATLWWLSMAIFMYVLRHLFYAYRLYYMTDKAFSFTKCIQLIVIWEFSSAISPTSVGGAGVAFLLLSQEKLPGEKTITVVLYSMVIDTIFILVLLPVLAVVFGAISVRPGAVYFADLDGYGVTLISVLFFMLVYGFVFFYGLFINPNATKRMLFLISSIPFLKRFKMDLRRTAVNMVTAAEVIKRKDYKFHAINFSLTAGAWTTRFMALNFIILALISGVDRTFLDQIYIFTRGISMYVITAFSPTPGGAGIAEYLFGGFFSDYIPESVGSLVALIWRLITYYPYLILGAIIIPIWIRGIIVKRRLLRSQQT